MQDCGATFYLEQTRDMTMFMPTNAAVKALLPVDLHKLPWEIKWRLLQYHIVPQVRFCSSRQLFISVHGSPLGKSSWKKRYNCLELLFSGGRC